MQRRNNTYSKKTTLELKQHNTVKVATFKPLSNDRYRCNQTGHGLRKRQITAYLNNLSAGGDGNAVIKVARQKPPERQRGQRHPSKYRSKR